MEYITEKPTVEEMNSLIEDYGSPKFKTMEYNFSEKVHENDLNVKGEAVIRIRKDQKIVGVRHKGGKRFVLPQGRIIKEEEILHGAKREALEETGFHVNITRLREIRKVIFQFKNCVLERWFFLFNAEILEGEPKPKDKDEIEEVKFLEKVPMKSDLY